MLYSKVKETRALPIPCHCNERDVIALLIFIYIQKHQGEPHITEDSKTLQNPCHSDLRVGEFFPAPQIQP